MGVLLDEAGDAVEAEAGAEAVDEMGEFRIVASPESALAEAGLHRLAALDVTRAASRTMSKPKPGSQASPIAASRSANRRAMLGGIAHRRGGADLDAIYLVSVRNSATCISRAPSWRCSMAAPSCSASRADCAEHVAFERDRIGESLLGHIGRHRQARRDRLVFPPERLVEAADQKFAEPGGERGARQVDEIGDALEAEFGERLDGLGRKAQGRRPAAAEALRASRSRRHQRRRAIARDRDGAADRVGDGGAGMQALGGKAREEVAGEGRLAAEQMGAARDVEHEAVRRRSIFFSLPLVGREKKGASRPTSGV